MRRQAYPQELDTMQTLCYLFLCSGVFNTKGQNTTVSAGNSLRALPHWWLVHQASRRKRSLARLRYRHNRVLGQPYNYLPCTIANLLS
jgi:hypothetical protein